MHQQTQNCYRGMCVERCNDPGTQGLEVSRLRSKMAQLRAVDADKTLIISQINDLEGKYQYILSQQQTVVTQYTTKLNIDNQTLNSLSEEIGFLKNKLANLEATIVQLLTEIQGLDKAIALKDQELRVLRGEIVEGTAQNETIHLENNDLTTKFISIREETISLGREEQNQTKILADNLGNMRMLERDLLEAEAELCKLSKQSRIIEDDNDRLKDYGRKSNKHLEIVKLQRLLKETALRSEELRNKVATLDQMSNDSSRDLRSKYFELQNEKERGEQLEAQLDQLESSLREKERMLMDSKGKMQQKCKYLSQLKAKHKQLTCQIEVSNSVILESQHVCNELRNEASYLMKADEEVRLQLQRRYMIGMGHIDSMQHQLLFTNSPRQLQL